MTQLPAPLRAALDASRLTPFDCEPRRDGAEWCVYFRGERYADIQGCKAFRDLPASGWRVGRDGVDMIGSYIVFRKVDDE